MEGLDIAHGYMTHVLVQQNSQELARQMGERECWGEVGVAGYDSMGLEEEQKEGAKVLEVAFVIFEELRKCYFWDQTTDDIIK